MTITDIDLTLKARITQLLSELELAFKEAENRGWCVDINHQYIGMSAFIKRPISVRITRNECL